jgi:hypothetical protein
MILTQKNTNCSELQSLCLLVRLTVADSLAHLFAYVTDIQWNAVRIAECSLYTNKVLQLDVTLFQVGASHAANTKG